MAERSDANVLGATLLGGILGAGLAVLFAPRSGKETRERINHGIDQAKDQSKELKDRLSNVVRNTGRKAASEVKEAKNDLTTNDRRSSNMMSAWEEEV